jgi:hypothetical protein
MPDRRDTGENGNGDTESEVDVEVDELESGTTGETGVEGSCNSSTSPPTGAAKSSPPTPVCSPIIPSGASTVKFGLRILVCDDTRRIGMPLPCAVVVVVEVLFRDAYPPRLLRNLGTYEVEDPL